MWGILGRHTPSPSFCSGSRIETMVRVSVGPSLTEGLGHGQVTPSQMLAVDGCKMLPLKPSHCFTPTGRRNGTLVSYRQFYKLASKLYLISRTTVTVDPPNQPSPLFLYSHQLSVAFLSISSLEFKEDPKWSFYLSKIRSWNDFSYLLSLLDALLINGFFKRKQPLMDKLRSAIFSLTSARPLMFP